MALLEICCYSMECALTAQRNGADRIELCAAPKEGGLTPSFGVLRSVREHITIPVHPIIRPRGGDFYYTDGEFAAMLEDIRLVRANPFNALKNLADAGVARVLTSGQKADAAQGLSIIMELIAQGDAPTIMAGAGVRANNLQNFLDAGVREVHSSAGVLLPSPMRYRNQGLSMSADIQAGPLPIQQGPFFLLHISSRSSVGRLVHPGHVATYVPGDLLRCRLAAT